MRYILSLILGICLVAMGCGKKDALRDEATTEAPPGIATMALSETNLARIVTSHSKAEVKPTPWASWWFPYGSNGIATAAAKYDTVYQNYLRSRGADVSNYQEAAAWERRRHSPSWPTFESWFGHCNGWSAAALHYPEPRAPKTIDGVEFSVGDQKALLAESWMEFSGDFVGKRVNDKGDFSSSAYWDIAPAQFTLILANVVSGGKRGIVFDRYSGDQIWNQPLVAYTFEPITPEDYLGAHPSAPDVYRVNMSAKIYWAEDRVGREDITPPFDIDNPNRKYFSVRKLTYELWLDGPIEFDANGVMVRSGDILVTREDDRYVGGMWKHSADTASMLNGHPDYMWVPFAVQGSTGYKNERLDDEWIRKHIAN